MIIFFKIRKYVMILFSFFINCLYWMRNFKHIVKTYKKMKKIKFKTIQDVEKLMSDFYWKADSIFDWSPWVITLIHKNLHDDCDGAANLGKWALQKIGIKSKIYHLWGKHKNTGKWVGHAICVSEKVSNTRIMVSNECVEILSGNDWKNKVLKWHFNIFNIIA